jgi:hypothetical protein
LSIFKEALIDQEKLLFNKERRRRHLKSKNNNSFLSSHRNLLDTESLAQTHQSMEVFISKVILNLQLHFPENELLKLKSVIIAFEKKYTGLDLRLLVLNELVSHFLSLQYSESSFPPSVPPSYKLPETNHPSHCYTDFEPRVMNSLSDIVISNPNNLHHPESGSSENITAPLSWKKEISFFDKKAVAKAEKTHLGYLDKKFTFMSTGNFSEISLNITIHHSSSIWLCELQKGFGKYPSTMVDLDKGSLVEVYLYHDLKEKPLILGESVSYFISCIC